MKFALPPIQECKHFSKELIIQHYQDDTWQKLITFDPHYRIKPTTMVVYDLSEQPLNGVVNSVIIDQMAGIILSSARARRLFMNFMKNRVFNSYFQVGCRQALGYRHNHALSFGNLCFMSAFGHRAGVASDWVGLHYMQDYQLSAAGCLFRCPDGYTFLLDTIPPNFSKTLGEVITHNCLASTLIDQAVAESGQRVVGTSLLYRDEYVQTNELHEAVTQYSASKLVRATAAKSLEVYGRNFSREHGLTWSAQAHYLSQQAALRTRLFH
jgi:hypothetical protein